METKAINDFTKFLESNGYCSSTIRIYISYAGPFLEALACQTQAELEKQINLIVDNNVNFLEKYTLILFSLNTYCPET